MGTLLRWLDFQDVPAVALTLLLLAFASRVMETDRPIVVRRSRRVAAAEKLVELAVLERGPNHAHRIAGEPPPSLRGVPDGLYAWQYGPLRGLTEEEFLARLRDSDWFYCVMFFRVLDAWILGEFTQADATPFMQWFRATYLT